MVVVQVGKRTMGLGDVLAGSSKTNEANDCMCHGRKSGVGALLIANHVNYHPILGSNHDSPTRTKQKVTPLSNFTGPTPLALNIENEMGLGPQCACTWPALYSVANRHRIIDDEP